MHLLAFMLILAGSSTEQTEPRFCAAQVKDGRIPVDILLTTDCLYDHAVSYSGRRTAVYDAFVQLYQGGNASAPAARRLVADATPEGRIYGLLILRHVAPGEAASLTSRMLQDRTSVQVMQGCITSEHSIGELVDRIRNGKRIISLPE